MKKKIKQKMRFFVKIGVKFIKHILIPFIFFLTRTKKGSWKEKVIITLFDALYQIPLKKLLGIRRSREFVEEQYDCISGLYIEHNYYTSFERFSIVDGQVKRISNLENVKKIRKEINNILSGYQIKSILEVGAGELTTLDAIYAHFGPEIDYYAIDLSLNRLHHGYSEFLSRHNHKITLAKANATSLPFPDNSFDMVFTRHCLEQMPTTYQRALDEIFRVSKGNVVLFEPSYELGTLTQKLKMIHDDYVRSIHKYINNSNKADLLDYFLMQNSANPLNHTACYKIFVKGKPKNKVDQKKPINFVCPLTLSPLEKKDNYLYCRESSKAYFVFNSIPILDSRYSLYITEPKQYTINKSSSLLTMREKFQISPPNQKVIINSVPHCGTHLVASILNIMGLKQAVYGGWRRKNRQKVGLNWRTATKFSNFFVKWSKNKLLVSVGSPKIVRLKIIEKILDKVNNCEYILSHSPHSAPMQKLLLERNWKGIFIIRDPRDMCLSMLNHIKSRPHHFAYDYLYNKLSSDFERIKAIVEGYNHKYNGRGIVSIGQMYQSMLSWEKASNFIMVRFEDLIGSKGGGSLEKQKQTIVRIMKHLGHNYSDNNDIIQRICENSFGKTATFRKGQIGNWKEVFGRAEIDLFKELAGNLLIELGYEKTKNW